VGQKDAAPVHFREECRGKGLLVSHQKPQRGHRGILPLSAGLLAVREKGRGNRSSPSGRPDLPRSRKPKELGQPPTAYLSGPTCPRQMLAAAEVCRFRRAKRPRSLRATVSRRRRFCRVDNRQPNLGAPWIPGGRRPAPSQPIVQTSIPAPIKVSHLKKGRYVLEPRPPANFPRAVGRREK